MCENGHPACKDRQKIDAYMNEIKSKLAMFESQEK
jgi:hypothetical protein